MTVLSGCRRDWREHNGYKIVSDHGGDRHAVVFNSSIIVAPRVTHWGTYRNYLLVYKIACNDSFALTSWPDQTGYAIINTNDGATTFTTTKSNYEDIAFKEFGIPVSETKLGSMYPTKN